MLQLLTLGTRLQPRMEQMVIFLFLLTTIAFVHGNPSAICSKTTALSSEFYFEFRFEESAPVTGLEFYDASENPNFSTTVTGGSCSTSTASDGIYSLSFDVDVDSTLPCGIVQDGSDSSVYKFAISPIGEEKVYTFQCDIDNLQIPIYVNVTNFYTDHIQKTRTLLANPAWPVKFQVVHYDKTQTPVQDEVIELGQPLHLRVIQDRGMMTSGKNLYGMTFHVGIFPEPGATVTLQISTLGLGTHVKITGELNGQEVDVERWSKRQNAAEIMIVDDYMPTGNEEDWKTEHKGLKIESKDSVIGVKVTVDNGFERMSYIAYPDRILWKNHRMVDFGDEQHFIIVATKDNTEIDLNVGDYSIIGLKVNGNNVGIGTKNINVNMDEYDTFHLVCDQDCEDIELTSNENIAVIVGMEIGKRFFTSQVPPKDYLDTEFIVYKDVDLYMTTDAIGTEANIIYNTTKNIKESDDIKRIVPFRLRSDKPLYTFIDSEQTDYLSVSLLPGRTQMVRKSYFYFTKGFSYLVNMIVYRGNIRFIRYETSDGVIDPFVASYLVRMLQGNPADIQYTMATFKLTPSDSDVYIFFSTQNSLLHTHVTEFYPGTSYGSNLISFTTLFPTINPCFPKAGFPNDGEDNDCDGFADEEFQNLVDDPSDLDTDIDDDLTAVVDTMLESKIKVVELVISDNAGFTGDNTHTIHIDGCKKANPFSPIEEFKHNTDLNDVYDDLWVLDTAMFRAFRFRGSNYVYFRVYIEPCYANCESSCGAFKRKRRSTDDLQHKDFKIMVSKKSTVKKDCSHNKYYWLPHFILMLIIIIEVTTTSYMLYIKYKLKRD